MLHPVVLCGGSGTRLFPLSRQSHPKQLLSLTGESSLFQDAVKRVVDPEIFTEPLIICNNEYRFTIAEQLQNINVKAQDIVLEPEGRNTAPAIALAAEIIAAKDPNGLMLILPSDHVIRDIIAFGKAVRQAEVIASQENALVTFGVCPVAPETGYGYIELGESLPSGGYSIESFREKPDLATAESYLKNGHFLWNSGMFLFPVQRILEDFALYQPEILAAVRIALRKSKNDLDFMRIDEDAFSKAPSISIDYAIMEPAKNLAVIPVDIGWSDVGSWSSLWAISDQDDDGNVLMGDVVAEESSNCLIRSENGLVATIGVENLTIINTSDVTLVVNQDKAQSVGALVKRMIKSGRLEPLNPKQVARPWGWYESIASGQRFQVKQIMVKPGRRLSLQKHFNRAEHWIVTQGTARVTVGEHVDLVRENESIYIPMGEIHRLDNPGKVDLLLIEIQTGCYLGEDDIVRLEDDYKREL
ncbi:mannose-1-phosphate guanylyltransferase/mannose-6-phosphate isomerase [Zymomonas mobilis]|uniref:mannose-1-phosphate guanylyltransferase n=1 Tax=Zymomonas mobilis subsp. pomaceae (strain ATCC 29192 / DSM 22645 / JCM 10191 / CCUG 17912 / NBRC 13757 / NCIMB 11200 / NRRL B-4491 / Barker I) TaxID=579138 RepID=F8ET89_ZYMMT|nr:mannose-1-phosphate guanylyltransferase/mannose-6-phosphate isomerase [Zymomonas mobilis]AEI36979.1 mannose-1-phosphate guanylyltransferase/mannose-6-phosphate isomerase [Zymomonas mobilis subsp. pomaceae ATCC 29192]MDX5948352.1 mannose-1-phosphate guanylyltransferase/mannose-6-phosphate isomerase [Zymomonas mobilis subsp. pomaceae]GEB89660.1 mannose-1-phosphate guanylyltransferase/mannose-6-phosphate isomerase [Zymomonas mobilis subsp. pomaceae]